MRAPGSDYDTSKVGRIEISATVSEVVAEAFEKTEALQSEGFSVTVSDIAGARYNARGDASRIRDVVSDPTRDIPAI